MDSRARVGIGGVAAPLAVLACALALCAPSPAIAGDSVFQELAADGNSLWFETDERLLLEDDDGGEIDVYEVSVVGASSPPTLISTNPAQPANANGAFGAFFRGASDDGSVVFFSTAERLDPLNDTDESGDVYSLSGGVLTLISRGQINGNGAFDASFAGNTADGGTVYFRTRENLVAADTDGTTLDSFDVYARSGSTTTLVSTGSQGNGTQAAAVFNAATDDGTRVFFTTAAAHTLDDDDTSANDVYMRSGSTTTLVSTGDDDPHNDVTASFGGIDDEGDFVFFGTSDPLVTDSFNDTLEDEDSSQDVYRVDTATPATGAFLFSRTPQNRVDPAQTALYHANTDDGLGAVYSTRESRTATVSDDPDGGDRDLIFLNPNALGGAEHYVSVFNDGKDATFSFLNRDGSVTPSVVYTTRGADTVADSDDCNGTSGDCLDVYLAAYQIGPDSFTRFLRSTGSQNSDAAEDAFFAGASEDASRVFFETEAAFEATDTDTARDVYRGAGGVEHISRGNDSAFPANFAAASGTANTLFETSQALSTRDIDSDQDVYLRQITGFGSFTILRSREAIPPETTIGSGPPAATNESTPTFTFFSNEDPNATFSCSLDGGAFEPCSGGDSHTAGPLGEGAHIFRVQAVDAAANVDATPAELQFEVDLTAPDTRVRGRRKKSTKPGKARAKVRFRLGADESTSGFLCKLDRGPFLPCRSPFVRRVKIGRHRLRVKARDLAGNLDPTPAVKRFRVVPG